MERNILAISLAVGLIGWACCAASPLFRRARARTPAPLWLLATIGALPVVVFAVSLLGRAPFTPGAGLGAGFLLGGIAGWMSLTVLRLKTEEAPSAPLTAARSVAAWMPPVASVAVAELWLRSNLVDTLAGSAIGWFCVAALLWIAAPRPEGNPPLDAEELIAALVYAVLLPAAGILAAIRGADLNEALKWAAAVSALGAAAPVIALLVASPSARTAAHLMRIPGVALAMRLIAAPARTDKARHALAITVRAAFAGLLLLALARLVERKLLGGPDPLVAARALGVGGLTLCAAIGIAAAALIAWNRANDDEASEGPSLLAVLLTLAAFMASQQLLGGIGCAVALISAWTMNAVRLCADPSAERSSSLAPGSAGPLALALLLLLYRTIEVRFASDLRSGNLIDHYALFGIVLAAALPTLLAARVQRIERRGLEPAVTAALTALAVPAIIMVVWGPKCVPAMAIGLALSVALAPRAGLPQAADRITSGILAIAIALALTQWTGHVLRLAVLTRAERAHIVYWIAGSLIALLAASTISAAAAAHRRSAARGQAQ